MLTDLSPHTLAKHAQWGKFLQVTRENGAPATAAVLNPVPTETFPGDSIAILVVDDNARYRHQQQRMVGNACPQAMIFEAQDTAEALRVLHRVKPQLVFVDVVLGDEGGIRCARRIKAASDSTRIVLISAYPDREFRRLGLEAGAVAFLDKKDLDTAFLRQVVEDVM